MPAPEWENFKKMVYFVRSFFEELSSLRPPDEEMSCPGSFVLLSLGRLLSHTPFGIVRTGLSFSANFMIDLHWNFSIVWK